MASVAWSLNTAQRDSTIARVTANICAMGLARNVTIATDVAQVSAKHIEQKAYTAAEVASNTTTGFRPASETIETYARKLGELLIEVVKSGGVAEGTESASAGGDGIVELIDLTGSREFLTKDSTATLLKAMLAAGSTVHTIKLSTKSFGRDAASVAADAIRNVAGSLTDADVSDVIAGRPEDEALDALRTLAHGLSACKLRHLNMSDNALGEKGVRALAEAFTCQSALESISLQNVGCSIYACRAVEELLQASQALRSIQLFNNMSDNEGAQYIARILLRAPLMEDLRMGSSRVGPSGGAALAEGLMAGRCLVKLDLSDNPITVDAAPALAQLVHSQPNLRILNLNDTSLTDRGVATICAGLTNAAPLLEELGLSLNEITPKGAQALAAALVNKPKLWKLNLRENELEDKGAVAVAKAVAMAPSLRVLDLCGNQIKRVGAVAVGRAAVALSGLELCALDENCLSENGLDQLRALFEGAGKAGALGPLDENMEEDEEDEEEEEGAEDDGLCAATAKTGV